MNRERILAVADAIERNPQHFNMSHFIYVDSDGDLAFDQRKRLRDEALFGTTFPCGTTACIGGWAVHLFGNEDDLTPVASIDDYARDLLGLPTDRLFYANGLFDLDATQIVTFLRRFVDDPSILDTMR